MVDFLNGLFENEPQSNVYKTDNGVEFIDGDTVVHPNNPNERIRFQGVDAYEVGKYNEEKDVWVPGDIGGIEATQITQALANKHGFTEAVTTGERDKYNRHIGDLRNPETGEYLSTKLLQSGLQAPTIFSSPEQMTSVMQGRLDRAQREVNGEKTDWDIAADELQKRVVDNSTLRAREVALDESEYAALKFYLDSKGLDVNDYLAETTQFRRPDRTVDNKAKSTISSSWDAAKLGFQESAYAGWDMIGDLITGERNSDISVRRIQRELADLPSIQNQNAFDEEGNWQIDSFMEAVDYVLGNGIQSSPYLVTSIIGFAHPILLTVPAFIYSGQTYAEQDDDKKDISDAITSGVGQMIVDRVGVGFLMPSAKNFIKNKKVRDELIELISQEKDLTIEDAKDLLKGLTSAEVQQVANASKKVIAEKVKDKYLTIGERGVTVLKAGAAEAVTEALQETIGFLGARGYDTSALQTVEYKNRIMNAAVAGGALGGSFSFISNTYGRFKDYSDYQGSLEADPDKRNKDQKRRAELKAANQSTSVDEAITLTVDSNDETLLDTQRKIEYDKRETQSFVGSVIEGFKQNGFLGAFRGLSDGLDARFGNKGKFTSLLIGVLGGNNVRSGGNIESRQHLTQADLQNTVGTEVDAIEAFGVNTTEEVSTILYDNDVKNIIETISDMDPDDNASWSDLFDQLALTLPDKFLKYKDAILTYGQKIHKLSKALSAIEGKKISFLSQATWDKAKIARNPDAFVEALMSELGMTRADAVRTKNNLLDQTENDIVEASSIDIDALEDYEETDVNSASLEDMVNNAKLGKFFNTNMFYNLANVAGTTASKKINKEFIGKNGSKLAGLIQMALDAGEINEEEASFLAQEVKDIIDIRKGKYKTIDNNAYKIAQSFIITWTTLAQLPLATVSAIVEIAQTMYNVPFPVLQKNIGKIVHAFVEETLNYLNEGLSAATFNRIPRKAWMKSARNELAVHGYLLESQTAAQKNDIRVSQSQQRFMDGFFKFIGLQGITNFTRTLRITLAADTLQGLMFDVYNDKKSGINTSQGMQSAALLQELGLDIDFMVDKYINGETNDPKYIEAMKLATFNFVNEAVAHPTKTNRPKFYQNPRLALFFQFQGFISTFTAQILPKIYGQLIGKGQLPAARAEALRNIITLIAMGVLSTYLRDFLKTGEIPEEEDIWRRLRRGVNSSGMLGTAERLVNLASPMYPQRHDNAFEAGVGMVTGEAPALSLLANVSTAAVDVFDFEESGKEWKKVAKVAPLTGPFHKKFEENSDSFVRSAIDSLF